MAIRTTEAVVLKTRPFRNASLIVTAYTKDFGKIQGLAKGIKLRCDRKDTTHHCYLEPLTLDKIVYYEKSRSGLHLLTQSDLLNQFQPIRHDLGRLAAASFMLELVDKGTQLEDANGRIFELLAGSLGRLCEGGNDFGETLLFFQMQFLKLSGFMPKDNKLDMPVTDFIKLHIERNCDGKKFLMRRSQPTRC